MLFGNCGYYSLWLPECFAFIFVKEKQTHSFAQITWKLSKVEIGVYLKYNEFDRKIASTSCHFIPKKSDKGTKVDFHKFNIFLNIISIFLSEVEIFRTIDIPGKLIL